MSGVRAEPPGYTAAVRNDGEDQLTPDLPPPVEAPELWRASEEGAEREKRRDEEERNDKVRDEGERHEEEGDESEPPDPEQGPGGDTATGEPPD